VEGLESTVVGVAVEKLSGWISEFS